MIDVPNAVSKHLFLNFLSPVSELDKVVNVFLKVLVEEFLLIGLVIPEGSLIV